MKEITPLVLVEAAISLVAGPRGRDSIHNRSEFRLAYRQLGLPLETTFLISICRKLPNAGFGRRANFLFTPTPVSGFVYTGNAGEA